MILKGSLTHFLCGPMPDGQRSSFPPLSAGLVVHLILPISDLMLYYRTPKPYLDIAISAVLSVNVAKGYNFQIINIDKRNNDLIELLPVT